SDGRKPHIAKGYRSRQSRGRHRTIYETFQEATRARGARKIKIINLGLEPWEAIEMGLEVEEIERSKKRRPVANYVLERDDLAPDGKPWEDWLQTEENQKPATQSE